MIKFLLTLFLSINCLAADIKISQLPLGSGATIGVNDSFPYVQASNLVTKRLTIYDLVNVPLFVQTYAPLASPTFTGTVTAPLFVGAVTGTSTGNTTITPVNHGVVISSATNALSTVTPDASTSKVLISGGASSNPTWGLASLTAGVTGVLPIANGGTNSTATATAGGVGYGTGTAHAYTSAGTSGFPLISAGASAPAFGQLSIAGGTNVTGTLALANGGTNNNAAASAGSIVYSDASKHAYTAVGSSGQHLQSAGTGTPTWTTATFPSTATGTGTILRADGTNWSATTATYPASTTANQILYSSASNVVGQITTAATSALVTNSSSVPSLTSGSTANRLLRTDGTTISFAQVAAATDISGAIPIANGGTNNASLSITGGTVYYGDGTKVTGLANGSSGQFLKSNGTTVAPSWGDAFTNPMTTGGDVIYGGASGVATRLANSSDGTYLRSSGGTSAPTWGAPVGAWTAFTPTGAWTTNTTYTAFKRKVGENYEYQIQVALSGAPTSANLTINIPDTIDTTKMVNSVGTVPPIGRGMVFDNGINEYEVSVNYNSTTSVIVNYAFVSGSFVTYGTPVNQAAPITFGNLDKVMIYFSVPIVGLNL